MVAVGLTIAAAGFAGWFMVGGGRIDWLWIDLLILLILVLGRYALQAMKHVEPQVKQVFQNLPKSVRQLFFFGKCIACT